MIPFELSEPTSLAAAVKLLNPDDPTIRPTAMTFSLRSRS